MAKFFIEKNQINGENIYINGENANHILNVLRYKIGDKIEISACDGFDYICEINNIENLNITAKIIDCFGNDSEPKTLITLYQGIPKGEKMEFLIQKCVEIGIFEIIPVNTERTIVKLSGKEEKKLNRWNKISESAAKQSRRGIIPEIKNIISFKDAIEISKQNDINFIPYEKENQKSIKDFIKNFNGKKIGIFIGPEGGFTENEIDLAIKNNIYPISLGKRILRTETAGMVTTAILLYEMEGF